MAHPLVRYCEEARQVLLEARDVLAGCELEEVFTPELRERFGSLYRRTARPEVRTMVTGPLKAGKSTLLNALARNPHVSQISQLPAYPCFVEVRDLERDQQGTPLEDARSMFYRQDGSLGRETSHQQGIEFLDGLLDDYIRAGKDAPIEYERVVQKVDLPKGEAGVELVLIDSPGLFFNRRVDATFFPSEDLASEAANPEVLDRTRDMYLETDVVIFVIRPEQLFFEAVADYLRSFARRTKMRVFILVNASTHSKVQKGTEIVDFNQVEEHEKIRDYFLQHIADGDLLDDIRSERRISLHFADLLDAATALFSAQGDAQAFARTPSGEVVELIRHYIFGEDLAALKIQDLSEAIEDSLEQADTHLGRLQERRRAQAEVLSRRRQKLEREIEEVAGEHEREKERLQELLDLEGLLEERLEITRAFSERRELPEDSSDSVVAEFASLAEPHPLPQEIADQIERMSGQRARQIMDQIYRRWRKGKYGPRTLRLLAEAFWESKLEDESTSLRSFTQQAVRDCFQAIVRQAARQIEDDQLRQCLQGIDPERLQAHGVNPALRHGLALLHFEPRFTFKWDAWKSGFRLTPEGVWGEDGERPIIDLDEERLLYDERKTFLRQAWDEPWGLGRCFSSDYLQGVARGILIGKISRRWGFSLSQQLSSCRQEVRRQDGTLRQIDERLQDLRAKDSELESGIERERRLEEDLRERRLRLSRLAGESGQPSAAYGLLPYSSRQASAKD
ncbi:MAG TPA: hypothetical protein VLU25_20180 [Acidobacteriota bacterium]|nr:hypothetical protein [Acidobacteriota bacterium]